MHSISALRLAGTAAVLAVAFALAGCSAPSPDPTAAPTPSPTGTSQAERYCVDSGGEVQSRQPTYGTNNDPSAWVALGDPVSVCRFQTLGDADDSRIYVDLVTLSSSQPTLAALAYLSKTPMPSTSGGANPATALCTELGGTSQFGPGVSGGGLVNEDDPIDVVFAPCTFADGSFIEEWGIAYYSNDTVRGADLAPLFRFDEAAAPHIFG